MPIVHYMDNSAILDTFERDPHSKELLDFLQSRDGILGLSEENLYELTPPNLNAQTKAVRRRTIGTLLSGDFPILFLKKRGTLRKEELAFLRKGKIPSINPTEKLALDRVKHRALDAMNAKYSTIKKGDPLRVLPALRRDMIQKSRQWFEEIKEMNEAPALAAFDLMQALREPQLDILRAALTTPELTEADLKYFIHHRAEFRTLDATYRAYCYFMRRVPHGNTPSPRGDIIPDIAHLVEAAYADVLISSDKSQKEEASLVLPHCSVMQTDEFYKK